MSCSPPPPRSCGLRDDGARQQPVELRLELQNGQDGIRAALGHVGGQRRGVRYAGEREERLGHSSVQLTLDVYTHATDDDLRAAVDRLDAWVTEEGAAAAIE